MNTTAASHSLPNYDGLLDDSRLENAPSRHIAPPAMLRSELEALQAKAEHLEFAGAMAEISGRACTCSVCTEYAAGHALLQAVRS